MMIGQSVVIITSPYSSVRPGTVATIERIQYKTEFTESGHKRVYTLYELKGLPHRLFYKYETAPLAAAARSEKP